MCSELFRIPYEWNGVPIFGVGVLLAIWAVVSAASIAALVRRYGWSGETVSGVPMLLLVGAAIVLLPRVFPEGLPIRGYGVMLLLGIISAVGLAIHRMRLAGLDPELGLSLAIWVVVFGVVGARLFYVVEYWDERFAHQGPQETLFAILNVPEGGLVVYGGFIGATIGFSLFVRKHGLPLLAMADLIAPSLMVGLAFGRIGCLLNGCCYGGHSELPWVVTFPKYSSPYEAAKPEGARRYSPPYLDQASRGEMHGFRLESRGEEPTVVAQVRAGSPAAAAGLKPGDAIAAINGQAIESASAAKSLLFEQFESQRSLRLTLRDGRTIDIAPAAMPDRSLSVHPTQLYSAIEAGLVAWLLWSFYPFRRRDGEAIALLLTIHPINRFLLEVIRTDEPEMFDTGMSISQNISIALLACALGLWWYLSRRPRGVIWPLAAQETVRNGPAARPTSARPSRS